MKYILYSMVLTSAQALAGNSPERIQVTAKAPPYQDALAHIIANQPVLDDSSQIEGSIANVLSQSPSISLQGQGGLLQTMSIRGFARWRIQTLLDGVPIHSDRRAGSALSFVPASMLEQAYVIAGAASTQLGSGAIGGGVDITLKRPTQPRIGFELGENNDYRAAHVAFGSEQSDLRFLANYRKQNNGQAAKGQPLHDGFEQHAMMLRRENQDSALQDAWLFYSDANNVAKASSESPKTRSTLYPNNRHLVGKLKFDWLNTALYLHKSHLTTQVTRPHVSTFISERRLR